MPTIRSLPSGKSRAVVMSVAVAVVALAAPPATGQPATGQPAPLAKSGAAPCGWTRVASPSPGIGAAELVGVDGVSRSNLWAVGSRTALGATLALHWNGRNWSTVPTPNKSNFTQLTDVTAVRGDNVWAVGFYVPTGSGNPKTLIEHWNGRRWNVVRSPNPRNGANVLYAVDAVSASNVWAVGGTNLNPTVGGKQIILHWNGTAWRSVTPLATTSGVQDVSAVSANRVMAVGHYGDVSSSDSLVQRYNGHNWSAESTSSAGAGSDLQGISSRSATNQWAVGEQSGNALQTLTMRETGSGWSIVASPNSSPLQINVLHDVATTTASEAWAVGYHENANFVRRTMAQHFVNGHWTMVSTPNPTSKSAELVGITAVAGDLWAVGHFTNAASETQTLIEARRC